MFETDFLGSRSSVSSVEDYCDDNWRKRNVDFFLDFFLHECGTYTFKINECILKTQME